MKKSNFLSLSTLDFWKGCIVAILTAGFTALTNVLSATTTFAEFNWQAVILAAASGFVAYIVKNFFSNSDGQTFKKEQ